jgi:hypothetical protein
MALGATVIVREYDGGRSVEFEHCGDFVVMETGHHAFAFDTGLLLHAMAKLLAANVDTALL